MKNNLHYILIIITFLGNVERLIAQDSLLVEAIKSNTYDLRVEEGYFSGQGASVIKNAIEKSQFLLVGEQHGIKEVAAFTSALFTEAAPLGYKYLCIETDSYIAEKLEELASYNENNMKLFLEQFPVSVPFYDAKEEYQLLKTVVSHNKDSNSEIWGVDQVFMATPRFLFTLLLEEAKTEEASKVVSDYMEKAKNSFDKFIETSNPQNLILLSLNEDDFKKIYDAFGVTLSEKAKEILEDIQITQEIYLLWATGKQHENNRTRSKLMKKQFMQYYNQALQLDSLPKVIFKFGATHTYRGLSMYHQFDLGNLASELAEMNNSHSVHFHVSGLKGMSQGFAGPPQSFDNYPKLNPFIKKVLDERKGDDWILIDVRQLRKLLNSDDLEKIKELVFGYDFWIYVPEAQPLTKF